MQNNDLEGLYRFKEFKRKLADLMGEYDIEFNVSCDGIGIYFEILNFDVGQIVEQAEWGETFCITPYSLQDAE